MSERDGCANEVGGPAAQLVGVGTMLLDAGLPVTDVHQLVESVRGAQPAAESLRTQVLPATVLVLHEGDPSAVAAGSSTGSSLSMDQAASAMRLVRRLRESEARLSAAGAEIRRIRSRTMSRERARWIGGTALVALGLAVLFRCPWWAVAVATAVAVIVGTITAVLLRSGPATSIAPFVAAFVSTLLVGWVAAEWDMGPVPLFAVCAPIAILVPGATITNALLELTSTDIVSGAARLMYGVIVLALMMAGIAAGAALTGMTLDPESAALVGNAPSLSGGAAGWNALPAVALSWLGVVVLSTGVGLAFGAGPLLGGIAVVTMLGTYGVIVGLTPPVGAVAATGIAAAVLFVAARLLERVAISVPSAVSFQPAFLLLVPGTVGLVAFTSADGDSVATALLTFVSLCIGVKVGSVVADTPWASVLRTSVGVERGVGRPHDPAASMPGASPSTCSQFPRSKESEP